MLLLRATTATTTTASLPLPLLTISSKLSLSKPSSFPFTATKPLFTLRHSSSTPKIMSWLGKLGFGTRTPADASMDQSSIAQGPDDDLPAPGQQFLQFGAGCFWGVELAFQRVPGVSKTEVGYTQGFLHNPTYNDVCSGTSMHSEVVRVQYDPKACSIDSLLDCFWERHDPTTLNRQKKLNRTVVTEILPAKKFYRAEEYHQQYLAKGGRFGFKQSTEKGCNDPIRCYG